MKNKFKKSKIIVPALALITATTVASVTGTVAWFTASRAVTVSAGEFVATKLESNLSVTTIAGFGTAISGTNGITTTFNGTSNKLTHGSYDAQNSASGSLYVANVNDDGKTIDSFANLNKLASAGSSNATTSNNTWLARQDTTNKVNIWYGISWSMKFALDGTTTNSKDYLIFDVGGSTFNKTTGGDTSTAPGLRIAFMTATKFLVVGGDEVLTHVGSSTKPYNETSDTTPSSGKTYYTYDSDTQVYTNVGTPTSFADETKYYEKTPNYESYTNNDTSGNYAPITATTAKLTDVASTSDATLSENKLCLGEVGVANNDSDKDKSLTITCVAWYEGSDEYVADKKGEADIDMSTISASLSFYTRGTIA